MSKNSKKLSTNNGKDKSLTPSPSKLAIFIPWVISLGIIFLAPRPVNPKTMAFAAFVAGLTGVIVIARKEIFSYPKMITGPRAIVQGILITGVSWILSFILFFYG